MSLQLSEWQLKQVDETMIMVNDWKIIVLQARQLFNLFPVFNTELLYDELYACQLYPLRPRKKIFVFQVNRPTHGKNPRLKKVFQTLCSKNFFFLPTDLKNFEKFT